jgi:hypothetical protein
MLLRRISAVLWHCMRAIGATELDTRSTNTCIYVTDHDRKGHFPVQSRSRKYIGSGQWNIIIVNGIFVLNNCCLIIVFSYKEDKLYRIMS